MRRKLLNGRWDFIVPDSIADWDAPTGSPELGTGWEYARFKSMETHLRPGMVLYDVGAEHGWCSAIYGTFCGHENMVIIEPSPEFWPNIRKTWEANGFRAPKATFCGFVSSTSNFDGRLESKQWWPWPIDSEGDECGAMAYRSLDTYPNIPAITIDELVETTGVIPDAITVDIEGAELVAMLGAENTLTTFRPLVWLSVHPDLSEKHFGVTADQVLTFMDGLGYERNWLGSDHEEHHLFIPRPS